MSRTIGSARHKALVTFIAERRLKAGLRQVDVAKKLGRYQSYVTLVETGQRRIDVVELMALADAIGFDPREVIKHLEKVAKK